MGRYNTCREGIPAVKDLSSIFVTGQGLQMRPDFFEIRKTALFKLREHQLAIDADFEASAALGDDHQLLQVEFLCRQDLFRQTDGL